MLDLLRQFGVRLLSAFRGDPLERLRRLGLTTGKNCYMLDGVIIDSSHCWHIYLGDDVTLAPRVHILAHDASTKIHLGYTRLGTVRIGSRVFVGAGTIILPGVSIGDDVIIGAGSVVTHDIPGGVVAAGNPARAIRPLSAFLAARRSELASVAVFGIEYTVEHAVTPAMKEEMNAKMSGKFGYVV